jgi:Flp pilus assembly protein TadD
MIILALLLALAPPTTEELVTLGEGLAQRGDGKKAQAHLDRALADPALPRPLKARAEKALGLALLQLKKPKDAVPHLHTATELAPGDEKAWLLLGLAHDAAEQFPEAIAAWQKGSAAVPKSATLKHELGMALLQAGRAADAAKILVDATKLAEQDPELRMDAAYALTTAGKFKEAKAQAELAVALAPDNADALYNLGSAEAGLHNARASRAALEKAIEIDELHVPSLLQLGALLSLLGDDAAAVKHFNRVLQIEPDNARAQTSLGTSLARLGSEDVKAHALLEQTLRVDPRNAQAQALLAAIAERAGKIDDAIKRLEQVRKLKPDDARVKDKLDELRAKRKAK